MFYSTSSRSPVKSRFWPNEVTPLCQNCGKPALAISSDVGFKFSLSDACCSSGVLLKCSFAWPQICWEKYEQFHVMYWIVMVILPCLSVDFCKLWEFGVLIVVLFWVQFKYRVGACIYCIKSHLKWPWLWFCISVGEIVFLLCSDTNIQASLRKYLRAELFRKQCYLESFVYLKCFSNGSRWPLGLGFAQMYALVLRLNHRS